MCGQLWKNLSNIVCTNQAKYALPNLDRQYQAKCTLSNILGKLYFVQAKCTLPRIELCLPHIYWNQEKFLCFNEFLFNFTNPYRQRCTFLLLLKFRLRELLINGVLFIPQTTNFKVKVHLDYCRIFTGPPNNHLVRSIIVKACEATIDPKEDMAEEKYSTSPLWLSRYS